MTPFRRLGVAGVGLIGGSFALAVRRAGLAREVVGWGRTRANLEVALDRGIVDRADVEPSALEGSDAVLLATPVETLAAAAAAVAPWIDEGALVLDAGSVKAPVVSACERALGARARFVGCHPIAGTERSGAAAASADLLVGATCALTPTEATVPTALARARRLWELLGMRVVELEAVEHDRWMALLSHVPHVLAFALCRALAPEGGEPEPEPLALAGPSFLGATRVAASAPSLWRGILFANEPALESSLDRFQSSLDELAGLLRARDESGLERAIAAAAAVRRSVAAARADAPAEVRVAPARSGLRGTVRVPGDKSITHRALLLAAVAEGASEVEGPGGGEDNAATVRVLRGLGVRIELRGRRARVHGRGFAGLQPPEDVLDCGNSGTTMRLVTGLLAGRPFEARLDGDESLRRRPMERVAEPLRRLGARIETSAGCAPLTVRGGPLGGAAIELPVASAQVKTAVLLAGLQATGRTEVREPAASRDHTERLLPAFGVQVERPAPLAVAVEGGQTLVPARVVVPGDPSAAAFWMVAGSLVAGSRIELPGVSLNPTRSGALDVLREMGARIEVRPGPSLGEEPVADLVVESAALRGVEVRGERMLRALDEFPVLAVAAACASGVSEFADGAELRVKETDRIAAMAQGLRRLGVEVEERRDGLRVTGGGLGGGVVESGGDHRVAMAFAVAGLVAREPVTVLGADSIAVSDPAFLATLRRLREGSA